MAAGAPLTGAERGRPRMRWSTAAQPPALKARCKASTVGALNPTAWATAAADLPDSRSSTAWCLASALGEEE